MENDKRDNNVLSVLILLVILLVISSLSYALWQIALVQTDENKVTSSCFKMTFKEENPINLSEALPITDEEARGLTPYEFVLTNTCSNYVDYQVNLEILNDTNFANLDYIKVMFQEKDPSILTSNIEVDKSLDNATKSYQLERGYLAKGEERAFKLRLWMSDTTPLGDDMMNKIFNSKVTIVTSYKKEKPSYASSITTCSKNGYDLASCMLENSKYDSVNLSYDETVDNNLRYIGKNPNNYVDFNNEKWRIIGVMNNIEDEDGNKESRIKLIREESIGNYSWDTSSSSINDGVGVNEWSQADIMKLLNPGYESETVGGSLYWDKKSGYCYSDYNNATKACDFTNSGLLEETKNLIETVKWNTGTNGSNPIKTSSIKQLYTYERSQNNGKICTGGLRCNDNIQRTTTWIGKVGLMHPSDYVYATSRKNITSTECLAVSDFSADNSCVLNNWLYEKEMNKYTINPATYETQSNTVLAFPYQLEAHNAFYSFNIYAYNIFPVLYLKSDAKITSGIGTKENSYQLFI